MGGTIHKTIPRRKLGRFFGELGFEFYEERGFFFLNEILSELLKESYEEALKKLV